MRHLSYFKARYRRCKIKVLLSRIVYKEPKQNLRSVTAPEAVYL